MLNIRKAVLFLAVMALSCVAAFGQTTLSTTSLSAAVTATSNKVIVASASGITVPGVPNGTSIGGPVAPYSYMELVVDQEVMRVTNVSGTTVYVMRGSESTRAVAHNSGAVVTIARPSNLVAHELSGACVINGALVVPRINPLTGHVFNCMATTNGGQWGSYAGAVPPVVGSDIASASTVAPTANVTHITGTTNVATITVPAGMPTGGQLTLIFDSANGFTAAGNIIVASSTTTSIAAHSSVTFTYDAGTAKWYPSHL